MYSLASSEELHCFLNRSMKRPPKPGLASSITSFICSSIAGRASTFAAASLAKSPRNAAAVFFGLAFATCCSTGEGQAVRGVRAPRTAVLSRTLRLPALLFAVRVRVRSHVPRTSPLVFSHRLSCDLDHIDSHEAAGRQRPDLHRKLRLGNPRRIAEGLQVVR
jgi:hypothetical protein